MKTTKKILLLGALFLAVITSSAFASSIGPAAWQSNFTPDRSAIPFIDDETTGLDHVSFNNFIGVEALKDAYVDIINPQNNHPLGDERKFLSGYRSTGDDTKFYNQIKNVGAGDELYLVVYFHNNGDDPFDADGQPDPALTTAKNVKVGIDLNNIKDPVYYENLNLVRPEGFIYADNNTYSGFSTHTATDDMQVYLEENNLELKTTGTAYLDIDAAGFLEWMPDGASKTITFHTDQGNKNETVTSYLDDETGKMYFKFNQVYGCTRYGGYAVFKVKVVSPSIPGTLNTCDNLKVNYNEHIYINTISAFRAKAYDQDGNVWSAKQKYWVNNAAYGKFYLKKPTNIPENPTNPIFEFANTYPTPTQTDTTGHTTLTVDAGTLVYFVGTAPSLGQNVVHVKSEGLLAQADFSIQDYGMATVMTLDQAPAEGVIEVSKSCQRDFNVEEQLCKEIKVTNLFGQPVLPIIEGQIHVFKASSTDIYNYPFIGDIKYHIDAGHGTFSSLSPYHAPATDITVPQGTTVYLTAQTAGTNVIRIDTVGTIAPNCTRWFSIQPKPVQPVCSSLGLTSTPAAPLNVGQPADLNFTNAKDTNGAALPAGTKLVWTTDTGGQLFIPFGTVPTLSSLLSQVPMHFQDSTTAGTVNVSLDPTDPFYSPDTCKESIEVKGVPICTELKTLITDLSSALPVNVTELKPATWYSINPDLSYNPDVTNPQVTYSSNYGAFVPEDLYNALPLFFSGHPDAETILNVFPFLANPITRDENTLMYFVTKTNLTSDVTDALIIKAADSNVAACTQNFNLVVTPSVCTNLTTIVQKPDSALPEVTVLEPATWYSINPDLSYNPDVTNPDVTYSSNYGAFVPEDLYNTLPLFFSSHPSAETILNVFPFLANPITRDESVLMYFVTNSNITNDIEIGLTIKAADSDVQACSRTYKIIVQPSVCTNLTTFIQDTSNPLPINETELKPAKWYYIDSDVTYTPENPEAQITYSGDYGVLIAEDFYNIFSFYFGSHPSAEAILATYPGLAGAITVDTGTNVYFVTKTNISADVPDALTIKAAGTTVPACVKKFNIKIDLLACQSVMFNFTPQPFDPTILTTIWFLPTQSNLGNFTGNFTFSAKDIYGTHHGKFYTPGNEAVGANPKEFTIAQATAGILFSGGFNGDMITVKATGNLSGESCNYQISGPLQSPKCVSLTITKPTGNWTEDSFTAPDEQQVKIEVVTSPAGFASNFQYRWEVDENNAGDWEEGNLTNTLVNYLTNINVNKLNKIEVSAEDKTTGAKLYNSAGQQVCLDSNAFVNEEEPQIEKSVYDSDKEEWRKTINISGNDDNGDTDNPIITYKADFTPGTAKSAEIWEANLENQAIEAAGTTTDGTLEFNGDIAIGVEPKGGLDEKTPYIIYKSDDFDEDGFDDIEINDDRISDFKDYNKDSGYLEDKYSCDAIDADSEKVCVENFSDLEDDFGDGNSIKLANTDKADKIFIIYQLENNTSIDDETCQDLDPEDGCGERFDNEINFKGFKDVLFDELGWEGDDWAKVVVICPYILTREGGDTFFYDEIDTGIDVSQCSEVENVPFIIRPREPDQTTPGTGTPTDTTPTLSMPTHDVCKLSNSGDANLPEEYQNVFKHFSSSVCEMSAQVAEQWTKENIVNAINANVEKIARWGETTGMSAALNSMNDLPASKNGVFVIENRDLTLGGNNELLINGTDKVPAAQTYIIKNGNLNIKNNIKYNDSSMNPALPKSIPSVAFVVINGNINISNNVTQIDGILMAVDTGASATRGLIKSLEGTSTKNKLVIRGSLIGDVSDLFKTRRGSGDPLSESGSITVRYEERLLLNTPAGLNELIDITQLRVAN